MNGRSKKRSGAAIVRRAASSQVARPPQPSSSGETRVPSDKPKTPRKRRPRFVL
jgi:hypothetical protein